jgi:bacteriocin-like protein
VNNDIHELSTDELNAVVGGDKKPAPTNGSAIFELKDFSFDIEQTLTSGARAAVREPGR